MYNSEDEPYSTIFTSLKHPFRRKMLRMLAEKTRSFSEMLEALAISSSHLTYHLENLGELVSKTDDGRYKLTSIGEAAVGTMRRVEETPKTTQPKHLSSFPIKWKTLLAALLIGLIVLAGASIVQHQFLNRISNENAQQEKVIDLVKKGALYQSEYDIRYGIDYWTTFRSYEPAYSNYEVHGLEPWFCIVYSLQDNSTLNISLSSLITSDPSGLSYEPSPFHMPTVQKGNVFDLRTNETAPMIWSTNETASSYSIPLVSKGWYTISLWGPLTYDEEVREVRQDWKSRNLTDELSIFWLYTLKKDWGEGLAWSYKDFWSFTVCWSASLTMTYRGTASPFIITTSALQGD